MGGPGGAELTGSNPGGGGVVLLAIAVESIGAGMGAGMGAGGLGDTGAGELVTGGGADFVAASMALPRRSLSSPASMMPDNVPVKNVAIGMINSKNLLSTGLMPFMGCVTKINE